MTMWAGGVHDKNSRNKIIHKSLKQLQILRQKHGNLEDTPDELYDKYTSIAAGLPDNSNLWSITLYSAYFCSLITNLKDKMEETRFLIPPLNTITIKLSQLNILCLVRTAAVIAFKALK